MKFDYLCKISARNKYDIEVGYGKDYNGKHYKCKKNGLGSSKESITDNDKKAFALVQRYNAIIEIENEVNTDIYHSETDSRNDTPTEPPYPFFTISTPNTNTTSKKTLTELTFENKSFTSFDEFKKYTESLINELMNCNDNNEHERYTLETFADYINKKSANKKVNLQIYTLRYDYPVLTRE